MENRDTNAIDKIIAELSMRDYKSQWNKLTGKQKYNVQIGKRQFSYMLSTETTDVLEIKHAYKEGSLSENDYKSWCLKYNLRTA